MSFDVENMFSGPQCSTQNVERRNIDKANLITRRHFQALELARPTGFYKNPVLNETSKFSKNIRKKSVSETAGFTINHSLHHKVIYALFHALCFSRCNALCNFRATPPLFLVFFLFLRFLFLEISPRHVLMAPFQNR